MSINSVWINCGAAFSCGAVNGVPMKQHGHLTPLQLNTLNHSTMQAAPVPYMGAPEAGVKSQAYGTL